MGDGHDVDVFGATAPPPVDKLRRRWRGRAVVWDLLLMGATMVLGLGVSFADSDLGTALMVGASAGAPTVLGALLASDLALTDWLTREDERDGRAYGLHLISTFTGCGRRPWVIWWAINLLMWTAGGALVGGVLGAMVGVAVGVLWAGGCLLLGVVVGWMAILPLGLIIGVCIRRDRTIQSARLLGFAVLLLGMLVLAVPVAWIDAGSNGWAIYLRAVVGIPTDHSFAPGPLLVSRIGVAVVALAVAPLIALLRSIPEQAAAGSFLLDQQD